MADTRVHCLDDDEVQVLAAGALPAELASPMLGHLGRCDVCRALVAAIARTHSVSPDRASPRSPNPGGDILARGVTIDRYVIEECIGRGGMGVIYAAYDPQLDRRIALKLVRADRASSPQLRERLVREARMMASLSDVNVVAVYDAGMVDDQVFIAMELVEGTTLTTWLHAGTRSAKSIIETFVLAGRGLAAAHVLGIVHRDFKPDNVLVSAGGRVRVSDFGLAVRPLAVGETATERDRGLDEPSERLTVDGGLVGTPAYMAPEQRTGGAVDARTDQYSFCVALSEALRGRRAPAAVDRALARGMSAAPSDRFSSLEALLIAIERGARSRHRRLVMLAGVAVALASVAAGWEHFAAPPPSVSVSAVRRLTFARGCEEYPSFIRGGAAVVFDGDVDGTQQLFTLDIASGVMDQLTSGAGGSRVPLVSPDGQRLAYEHHGDGPRELRLRRLDDAGSERSLGVGSTLGGSWLDPDRLAIIGGGGALYEIAVDALAPAKRPLYSGPGLPRFGLTAAFTDGTLAVSWWNPPSTIGVGLLSSTGLHTLVDRLPYTDGALLASPSDDALYFVRRAGAANELVRQPRSGAPLTVVGGGIAPARGIAISPNGSELVFSTCASHAQLVRIGDGGALTRLFAFEPWSDAAPAPIGADQLLFASDRSGHDQLYLADLGSDARPRALTGLDVEEGVPSADGRAIVYAAHQPGGVWLATLDASAPPRRLTDGAHDEAPQFSRDGTTIYFVRGDAIFAMPRAGGQPRLLARPGYEPVPSRVDDRLYFLRRGAAPAPQQVMSVDRDGTVSVVATLPPGNAWSLTASADGATLAVVHEGFEIFEIPLDGSPLRLRTRVARWISSLHYAFAGRELWASVEELDGDLWLATGRFR